MLYDLFICHASEDKEDFVRPLANALKDEHIEVWYDEFSLKLGDSIRRSIDKGLSQSRFGVVVISDSFLKKEWPQYELDGLVEKEINGKEKVILPIWHNIKYKDIFKYSPSLAGKKAAESKNGLENVVKEIINVVHPQGSPLIIARDKLIEWGITPPVITDSYWLDVIEASNRSNSFGASIAPDAIWGRWCFPLPQKEREANQWGERLAWTAMQLNWCNNVELIPISPLTRPEIILDFIDSQPGLYETCAEFPRLTIEYAPQLTIKTFGGNLEAVLEEEYLKSYNKGYKNRIDGNLSGSGLTVDGKSPECDEEWALRHEQFGFYEPRHVAYSYFHGGMFGPQVSPFDEADHLFWILSNQSEWLPTKIHSCLKTGMLDSLIWTWGEYSNSDNGGEWLSNGKLLRKLYKGLDSKKEFIWDKASIDDCKQRIKKTIDLLSLPESVNDIFDKVVEFKLPDRWIYIHKSKNKKRK